jgi:hypothetical protein
MCDFEPHSSLTLFFRAIFPDTRPGLGLEPQQPDRAAQLRAAAACMRGPGHVRMFDSDN